MVARSRTLAADQSGAPLDRGRRAGARSLRRVPLLPGACRRVPVRPARLRHGIPAITDDLVQRLRAYMNKSIKEAKVHTSWINENRAYDDAVVGVRGALARRRRAVRQRGLPFIQRVARAGAVNSLAQLVLKLTSPGVPDFYQGTELWDLTLVDPDNRRPVDFDHRVRLLDAIEPLIEAVDAGRSRSCAQGRGAAHLLARRTDQDVRDGLRAAAAPLGSGPVSARRVPCRSMPR